MSIMQRLTLIGLYSHDNTLFDNVTLPTGYDKDTFIETLLLEHGEKCVMYPEPEFMKYSLGIVSRKWRHELERIYIALMADYNPIWNYDRNEEYEDNRDKKWDETTDADYNESTTFNSAMTRTPKITELSEYGKTSTDEQLTNGYSEQTKAGSDKQTVNGYSEQTKAGSDKQTVNGYSEQTKAGSDKQTANGFTEQTKAGTDEQKTNGYDNHITAGYTDQKTNGFTEQDALRKNTTEKLKAAYNSGTYLPDEEVITDAGKISTSVGKIETSNGKTEHSLGKIEHDSGKTENSIGTVEHDSGKTENSIGTVEHDSGKTENSIGKVQNTLGGKDSVRTTGTDENKHTGIDSVNTVGTLSDRDGSEFEKSTHKAHLWGNIGVTTSAAMVAEETSLRMKNNLYEIAARIFANELLINIY